MSLVEFAPFLLLGIFGLAVTPVGLIGNGRLRGGLAPSVGILGLLLALGSTIWFGLKAAESPPVFSASSIIRTDLFTYFFAGVLLIVSIFVAIASLSFMKGDLIVGRV